MTNRVYAKGDITCVCGTVMSFVWDLDDDQEEEALCPVCETTLVRAPIRYVKNNGWHQIKDKKPNDGQKVWLCRLFLSASDVKYSNVEYAEWSGETPNWAFEDDETMSVKPDDYWMSFTYPPGPGTPKKDFTG